MLLVSLGILRIDRIVKRIGDDTLRIGRIVKLFGRIVKRIGGDTLRIIKSSASTFSSFA